MASSCFLSVCTLQFFLLDGASSMQMIYSIFKVFVFLPVVLNDIYFSFVFCPCGDSDNPVPQKLYLYFCVLDTVEDESVMVFEATVELNSQSEITVTSF